MLQMWMDVAASNSEQMMLHIVCTMLRQHEGHQFRNFHSVFSVMVYGVVENYLISSSLSK